MPFVLRKEASAKSRFGLSFQFRLPTRLNYVAYYIILRISQTKPGGRNEKELGAKGCLSQCAAAIKRNSLANSAIFWMVALGVGLNAGVFAVRSQVFPYLPYLHPEQLVILRAETEDGDTGMSADDFIGLGEQTAVFQNLSASTERAFRLNTRDGSQDVAASLVTAGFFQMMGERFYLGNDRVAILSHSTWEQLGADKFVVGSTIWMNKTPYTVVGVLAAGLRDRGASVTVPLILTSRQSLSHPQWVNVFRSAISNGKRPSVY